MAATVELRSYHDATGVTGTDVAGGNMRFKRATNDTVDANNPIPIPATAIYNYSYLKQLKLYATVAPDNAINNLKFYTDGSNPLYGTGCMLFVSTSASYTNPATQVENFFGGADAQQYTSVAPLTVSGSIGAATGAIGDWTILQFGVTNTATQGVTTSSEVLTWSFDES